MVERLPVQGRDPRQAGVRLTSTSPALVGLDGRAWEERSETDAVSAAVRVQGREGWSACAVADVSGACPRPGRDPVRHSQPRRAPCPFCPGSSLP